VATERPVSTSPESTLPPGEARGISRMDSQSGRARPAYRAALRGIAARPLASAVLVGTAATLAAFGCGLQHWRGHPIAAVVTLLECGATAAAGVLLATGRGTRRTGQLMVLAAFFWALTWLAAWNAGPWPIASVFAQSAFFFTGAIALLYYPDGRLHGRPERIFTAAAAVVLFGGQVVLCLAAPPGKFGFAATVVWPSLDRGRGVEDLGVNAVTVANLVLAVAFAAVLWWRGRRLHGVERALTLPVLGLVAVIGGLAAVIQTGALTDLDAHLDAYVAQGTLALLVPLALLGVGLRQRWSEVAIADQLLRLTHPPSAERVQAALREVLHDASLELYFWVPRQGEYVDQSGRAVPGADEQLTEGARWRVTARTDQGAPLAVIDADAELRRHESLVRAALTAGGRALENAQLHAEVQARIEQVRAAQMRVLQAEAAERQRMERDLHDGAQQRLVGLAMRLAAIEESVAEPDARAEVRRCREAATEALSELRAFVRGIHPGLLADEGLSSALESLAERLQLSITLEVTALRPSPGLERAIYLTLAEAMTNAARHAGVNEVLVRCWDAYQYVVGEVVDAGVGGAKPAPGGGLAGIQDRARALRGEVEILSPPDAGTTVRVWLPT
jgi:signal transduction histidine kinase